MKKLAYRDFIIYFIFLMAITLNITDSTFKFMQLEYKTTTILLISAATLIYMWASTNYKYALLIIIVPIIAFNPTRIFSYIAYMIGNFISFIEVMFTSTTLPEEFYGLYFMLVYIILVVSLMAVFYFVVIKKNTTVLLVVGTALYVSYYFMGTNNLDKNCSTFLALCIILFAYNEYMKRKNHWSSQDTDVRKNYFYRWISLTVILVVFTSFLTQIMKYDIEPASFDWFENNVISRLENLTNRGREVPKADTGAKFQLSQTGYQQNPGRLGGPIKDDKSLAFRLLTKDETVNLHLRGNVQDTYDGVSWGKIKNDTVRMNEPLALVNETEISAVEHELKSIVISPEKTLTTTAFNPLYPFNVINSWKYYFAGPDNELYNPRAVKKGKSYEVQYNEYDIKELQSLLVKLGNNTDAEKLKNSSDFSKYFEVSGSVPERVKTLTNEVVSKSKTPFEKASAIENYLKKEFKYDKETSILPKDKDFVDYFLFDEKKGYCTYFASAMAVMCRIAGIPTRYIEGYAVTGTLHGDGMVDVLNSDAHAWVEVYFNEVGWVTFDPTPGMSSIALEPKQEEGSGGGTGEQGQTPQPGRETPEKPTTPVKELPGEQGPENGIESNTINPVYIIMVIALMVSAAGLVVLLSLASFRKKKFLAYSLQKLLIYGSFVGARYEGGQTIREFVGILSKTFNRDLEEYINLYEGNLYGGKPASTEDWKKINNLLRVIRKDILHKNSRLKFYLYSSVRTLIIPFRYRESR